MEENTTPPHVPTTPLLRLSFMWASQLNITILEPWSRSVIARVANGEGRARMGRVGGGATPHWEGHGATESAYKKWDWASAANGPSPGPTELEASFDPV